MGEDLQRKNELDLIKVQGEIKLLSERIDVIKNNDLRHVQKSLDFVIKLMWGIGFLILSQLAVAIRLAL
jgi:hypothetical protein